MNTWNELLKCLVCPLDRSPLEQADAGLVLRLNQRIALGHVQNRSGRVLREKLDGGLIRADHQIVYPVRDGIPVILAEEAISMDQLPSD